MNSFYRKVWQVVALVPAGNVATYGQIANLLGKSGYARQVSYALFHSRRLAPNLTLPWHRIINSKGKIAFPPSDWRHIEQKQRLEVEGIMLINSKRLLEVYQWRPSTEALKKIQEISNE